MGVEGDFWRAVKDRRRRRKLHHPTAALEPRPPRPGNVYKFPYRIKGIEVIQLSRYHYRLDGVVDYWPNSEKAKPARANTPAKKVTREELIEMVQQAKGEVK